MLNFNTFYAPHLHFFMIYFVYNLNQTKNLKYGN